MPALSSTTDAPSPTTFESTHGGNVYEVRRENLELSPEIGLVSVEASLYEAVYAKPWFQARLETLIASQIF